ncbi:KIP1-like [Macleaya cordata]|uniref:KIP1-like n=1 Tax=Macleaya cordata TaxID=56857 RepID=A0A200R3P8_MACCD|nr:KIP1-like [Macleaya cordata]
MSLHKKMTRKSLTAEMDRSVKRMLKLIEEEGDSFAKKAEMYYQKRPELISQVEEFYRMYRSLAERYDNLTGELRKSIPSELQTQGSGFSDAGSEAGSPVSIPDRRRTRRRSSHRAAGFDVFLGAGGGSPDIPHKAESDESSSSSSDSESDSGDDASSKNNYSGPSANGDGVGLSRRIIELEVELRDVKEKLRIAEEENSAAKSKVSENGNDEELLGRITWYEEELNVTNGKLQRAEEEIERLKLEIEKTEEFSEVMSNLQTQLDSAGKDIEIRDNELKLEKSRVLELQERIAGLNVTVHASDKIEALEAELLHTNKKLEDSEAEISRLKLEIEENKSSSEATHDLHVESPSAPHNIESRNIELGFESNQTADLEGDVYLDQVSTIKGLEEELRVRNEKLRLSEEEIATLILELEGAKSSLKYIELREAELQDRNKMLEVSVSSRDQEIRELKVAISDADQKFSLEKSQLETVISGLSESRSQLERELKDWESRVRSLEEEIKRGEAEKTELRVLQGTREVRMHTEMERLKAEIGERGNRVEELNKSLDALKLKYDMLTAERDGVNAKVSSLVAEVGCRDDRIGQMEEHLHRLHLEHVELITRCEGARKQVEEQRMRLRDLEEEVERQRVVISEGAEEKREAIRQLCFSLEHYRNSYHQLRQAFLVHKRPASPVLAS